MLSRIYIFPFIGLFILTAILSTGCGGSGYDDGYGTPTQPSGTTSTGSSKRGIEVKATSFKFEPKQIAIDRGDQMTVKVTSADMRHIFTIDALKIKVDIPAKKTMIVNLMGKPEGTYTFYCTVPGHRERGMVGTLSIGKGASTGQSGGSGSGSGGSSGSVGSSGY